MKANIWSSDNAFVFAAEDLRSGPQRENFPGGTKVDSGPPNVIGPPSLIEAHGIKSIFVRWV